MGERGGAFPFISDAKVKIWGPRSKTADSSPLLFIGVCRNGKCSYGRVSGDGWLPPAQLVAGSTATSEISSCTSAVGARTVSLLPLVGPRMFVQEKPGG